MSTRPYKPFKPANPGDSRSPCPALNALANHSYLPHNGKNIGFFELVDNIQEIYHISVIFSWILAAMGLLLCGRLGPGGWFGLPIRPQLDLHDLALHDRIEHDASLAHANVRPGHRHAPTVPDPALLAELLGTGSLYPPVESLSPLANGGPSADVAADAKQAQAGPGLHGVLTFHDLARVRLRRDKSLAAPLDFFHALLAVGEVALVLQAMGQGRAEVKRAWLLQWMGEERLPDGYARPKRTIGLLSTNNIANAVKSEVAALKRYP